MSARPDPSSPTSGSGASEKGGAKPDDSASDDEDLKRAKDLVDLHHAVKENHGLGHVDEELSDLRRQVAETVRSLE